MRFKDFLIGLALLDCAETSLVGRSLHLGPFPRIDRLLLRICVCFINVVIWGGDKVDLILVLFGCCW